MRKILILVAAWLLSGCAGRPSSNSTPITAPPKRLVTALAAFTARDLPRAYHRIHDDQGWKWVLWSHESLCIVDSGTWTRTQIGDRVSCDWRMPRG